MKKINFIISKIVLLVIILISDSYGQFIIPTPNYTEYPTGVTVGPYNTGNDILDFSGDTYAVSVSSDLTNAGLYWNVNGITGYAYFAGGAPDIYHADVCLVVDLQSGGLIHAIVGWYYGGTGGIPSWYIEDYLWDGSSVFNLVTSTFVNGGFANTLNIDGDDQGNFIMVYDENTMIGTDMYALTGNINGGTFNINNGGNPVLIGSNSYQGKFPDVSIYSDGLTTNQVVHLAYIDLNGDLNIEYDSYSNIAGGSSAFTAWTTPISPVGGGFVISNPRIASPNSSGAQDDWTVVWQEDDRTTAYYIKGLNSKGGSLSSIYIYNDGTYTSGAQLNDVENWQPVVAYDYQSTPTIWVGWIFDNRSGYYGYSNSYKSMYPIGIKCNDVAEPPIPTDYWQIPNYMADDLEVYPLSLASRYASSDQLLLTYYLANSTPEVCNKLVPSSSATEFKLGSNANSLPASNFKSDELLTLKLFDSKGNKILDSKGAPSELLKIQYQSKLPPAIYFLQMTSANGAYYKTEKLFIQ